MRLSIFILLSGSVLTASAQTTLKVDVRMIEVYASVTGPDGKPITHLNSQDFRVFEDGIPQQIRVFEPQSEALTIALLIDTTDSMFDDLPQVKNGLARLLPLLRADDDVGLYTFANGLTTLSHFTSDRKATLRALLGIRALGSTALFDSMAQLSRELSRIAGKKAIVLFTDGDDNSSAMSLEAATRSVQRVGAPVYAILNGSVLTNPKLLRQMQDISKSTAGLALKAPDLKVLPKVFSRIGQDLQHLYMVAYQSNNESSAEWRSVTVTLPAHPQLKLRTKEGYWR